MAPRLHVDAEIERDRDLPTAARGAGRQTAAARALVGSARRAQSCDVLDVSARGLVKYDGLLRRLGNS